jgi:hypothetical protein
MKRNIGKTLMKTSFRNSGRIAGMGMAYDDYSEESGNPGYCRYEEVRLPHDGINPEELNGPVICYKGEHKKEK